jgi:hypothetical protein
MNLIISEQHASLVHCMMGKKKCLVRDKSLIMSAPCPVNDLAWKKEIKNIDPIQML